MNCFVFLFTRDGVIYASLGLSSPGLEKSLSLAINLHHVCFLSAVTDDLPFNSLPPCGGDTSSIRDHFSAAVRGEGPGRVTPVVMMVLVMVCVCVCVCVFLLIWAYRKQGAVTSAGCCAPPSSPQMNWLFMGAREESLVKASSQCTRGDREEGYSSAILELMNIILASVHVQGEGDMSLVLAFLPMPSA